MKVESASFGRAELRSFFLELATLDRDHLVRRLEACGARLEDILDHVSDEPPTNAEWSAREVMAHIAILTKYYGVLTYQISSGKIKSVDLLGGIRERDVLGLRMSQQAARELGALAVRELGHTVTYVRGVDPSRLRRRAQMLGLTSMSAEEVCRISLCTHLEQHLEQLEKAVGEPEEDLASRRR